MFYSKILLKLIFLALFFFIYPPKSFAGFPEGVELNDERIENLASVFPLQYLSMFEQMRKGN